jgi:hypothetical protein
MFIRNVATRLADAEDLGTATPRRLFKSPVQNMVMIFQTVRLVLVQT